MTCERHARRVSDAGTDAPERMRDPVPYRGGGQRKTRAWGLVLCGLGLGAVLVTMGRRSASVPVFGPVGPGVHPDAWGDGFGGLDDLVDLPTDEDLDLLAPDPYHASLCRGTGPANQAA
jgi:hypothetical protein